MGKNEQKKFDSIYNQYHQLVRGVLYNMVGREALEDLTQEAFIRIWNGLPRFAFRSSIKTWIYRITVNTAIDHLRKRPFRPSGLLEERLLKEELSDNTTEKELVESSLSRLDDETRSIVVLHYFEEMSLRDISNTLEIPEGTVKSRLFYAKKKIRSFLLARGVSI